MTYPTQFPPHLLAGRDPLTLLRTNSSTAPSDYTDDHPDSLAEQNLELDERHALRRVPGLSTELADVTEVEYRQLRLERVVLVGVWTQGTAAEVEQSLVELGALAETAGSLVLEGVVQRRDRPDPATYLGSGKARELGELVLALGADTVICDGELSPGQLRQLEQIVKVKVVDRTALILDIFAQHAKSREGKAQVELAQMSYMLPRLRGWGESMSRQAGGRAGGATGGVGTRGPGETKIETDRRRIRARMSRLRREIAAMATARTTQRSARRAHQTPSAAIVGYTNAGKSSLLNRLTGAGVLVEDALFATLDPTVRRTTTRDGREYTLADTVGFVRHLPHQLVEAFRSTLEEAADADVLVHVVDGTHPDPAGQILAVREVLAQIDADQIPELIVINKIDAVPPETLLALQREFPDAVSVAARTGVGFGELRDRVEAALPRPELEIEVRVPFDRGELVHQLHTEGQVLATEHRVDGTQLRARVSPRLAVLLAPYRC